MRWWGWRRKPAACVEQSTSSASATSATAPAAAHSWREWRHGDRSQRRLSDRPCGRANDRYNDPRGDGSRAPALPAGLTGQGNTYVITPHGGNFAQPVQVRIPAPAVTLQPNQELKLAKVQPGEPWEVLAGTTLTDGVLSAEVNSFSFFRAVVVTYPFELVVTPPLQVTGATLDCGPLPCNRVFERVAGAYAVTTNNGQLPLDCDANGHLQIIGKERNGTGGRITQRIQSNGGSLVRSFDRFPRGFTT